MKRLKVNNANRNFHPVVFSLAIFLLILLLPGAVEAANYIVQGRVYCAYALEEGEDVPINPLTDVPGDQVIGDEMFAVVPRDLVKVSVIAASDGSELGSYIARYDGGYFINFTGDPGGISVRFVVEELSTSQVLLDSDELTLSDGGINIRYLLVLEGLSEIGGDREYAPTPPSPPQYTGIFTRVGKIEVATEVEDPPGVWTTTYLIEPATGLANVPEAVAHELAIHKYEDAPFGGNLYIFGAFSLELYDNSSIFYRIKYVNDDDASDNGYIDDSLVKTKYTADFVTGEVSTERVTLGPLPAAEAGGYENCYKLTPIAESSNVFWSFPDLVALWRTGQFNGKYTISIEIIDLSALDPENPVEFIPVDNTNLTLRLENVSPSARILALGPEDSAFPTPRVYTPGPAVTDDDLVDTLLGSFPLDYGGTGDFICAILNLEGGGKYLAFKLKAYHDNGIGYLRYWRFEYKRNDTGYTTHIGKRYNGTSNTMEDDSPVQVTSGQNSTNGFTDKFIYLSTEHLQPGGGTDMGSCAYRFVIKAATRTTDGYNYLRWSWDEDLHYIQR